MGDRQARDLVRRALGAPQTFEKLSPLVGTAFPGTIETLHGLIRDGKPALLLGAPGSGKTTILTQVVLGIQEEAVDSREPFAAFFFRANEFGEKDAWLSRLATLLSKKILLQVEESDLLQALSAGSLALVIDGLDEISPNARANLSEQLTEAIESAALTRLLVASRSTGAPHALAALADVVTVPSFDRATAGQFLLRAYPHTERNLEELYDLSGGNPLLLRLLGESANLRGGALPQDRAAFLRDAVEGLLVVLIEKTWTAEQEGPLSIHQIWRAHEELAFRMLADEKFTMPRESATAILERHLSHRQADALLKSDEAQALLIEGGSGELAFSHRLIAEFFAASSSANDVKRLRHLATLPGNQESVALALSLADDPTLAIVALAESPGLSTLQRLKPLLGDLPRGALEHARQILTERAIDVLSVGGPPSPPTDNAGPSEGHGSDLLDRWLALEASESYGYERGLELELFMVDFFGRFFEVVEHDYRTEIGQIDLLLENIQNNPFWLGHDADIYVECKNTRASTEQGAINAFAGKLASSPATLSFFVSQTGFTPPALARLRSAAQDPEQTTIVPITGDRVRRTLEDSEEAEHFFKTLVRSTRNGQMFMLDS